MVKSRPGFNIYFCRDAGNLARLLKKYLLLVLCLVAGNLGAQTGFDPAKDEPAFANETFFAYGNQHTDARDASPNTGKPYSRRCFVLCRAVMQFYQFAEFAPQEKRLDEVGYRKLIRRIARVPVSQKRNFPRIRVPGFANLREFSESHPRLLQDELGNWWPTYLRPGNWRMGMAFPRSGQEKLARIVQKEVAAGRLAALYITRFKPLNHCLVVYACRETPEGVDFSVYDPNLPGRICLLKFDAHTSSFLYQKTWYFRGGRVNAVRVYHCRWL